MARGAPGGAWTAAQQRVLGPARDGGRGEPREVTVDGSAEDAQAYRLDVIRDLTAVVGGAAAPRGPPDSGDPGLVSDLVIRHIRRTVESL